MKKEKGIPPFLSLVRSTNIPKLALTVGLIGSMLTTLVGLTIPLLTRELVDGFSVTSINSTIMMLLALILILQAVIDGYSAYLLGYVGQQIIAGLRERMWVKLIRLPVRYFDKHTSGESVSRVVNDTGIVKDLISQYFPQFIGGFISILGAVTILFIMDWKMTLMMLLAVPLTMIVLIPLGAKMVSVSRGLQDETAAFSGSIQQTLSEVRLMKASTAEAVEKEKGLAGIQKLFQFGLKETKILALISPLISSVMMLVIVVIIGYGGIRVVEGSMSTGSLVAFLLYLFQIVLPITAFAMFFTQLQKAKGATERIIGILELEDEVGQNGIEKEITNESIEVSNVSFAYNQSESVLRDVSFTANPGDMVAFVGPSGAGKTTLFALLERYYEPDSGEIKIGSTPTNELSLESWRSQIGYVSQENAMMAGTIRENLTYGLPHAAKVSDEQLWRVTEMAYADGFIQEFTKGLDTEVGERGVKLSGGQKQRINIARAFLRDPKLLMMDEATASLDSQSERIVQAALSELMKGRTTLVIAHRLSTIVEADKIIFIENGKVTGSGTHQELIQVHDLYREFTEQQLT